MLAIAVDMSSQFSCVSVTRLLSGLPMQRNRASALHDLVFAYIKTVRHFILNSVCTIASFLFFSLHVLPLAGR
jgi:hypothetical protein